MTMAKRTTSLPLNSPEFIPLTDEQGEQALATAGARRDWSAVKEALLSGAKLFIPDAEMSPQSSKYLSLAFGRNAKDGGGERRTLHARPAEHEGVTGKLFWLDAD